MLKFVSSQQPMFTRRYEFSEQPTDFTGELTLRLWALRDADIAIPRVLCPQCGGKMRLAVLEPYLWPSSRKETTTFTCGCGEKFSYTIAPHL